MSAPLSSETVALPIDPSDEAERRTREVLALLRQARSFARGDELSWLEAAEATLGRREATVVLMGAPRLRATLLDAVIGDRVFEDRARTVPVQVRAGAGLDLMALASDQSVERFGDRWPDPDASWREAADRAELDRAAALERASHLQESMPRESMEDIAPLDPSPGWLARLRALWLWLLGLLTSLFGRRRLAAAPPAPTQPFAVRLAEAKEQVEQASARVERARQQLETSLAERRAAFAAEARALLDPLARGADVAELHVEVGAGALPEGVVLSDGGAPPVTVGEPPDACLLLGGHQHLDGSLGTLAPIVPWRLDAVPSPTELFRVLEHLRGERLLVRGLRAASRGHRSCQAILEAEGQAAAHCRKKIARLEEQRIGDPAAFRARALARIDRAIEDSVEEILKATVARLNTRFADLGGRWTSAIRTGASRAEVEAQVHAIDTEAAACLGEVVTELSDLLVVEMQRSADTMQLWILEEVHARTRLARHLLADEAAAVLSAVTPDDFAELGTAPLTAAMTGFESRRVGLGLGGAAAGALIGTLLVPGIGTAIGAFLGTFAGFLQGVESLRNDCSVQLAGCLERAQAEVRAQLEARRPGIAQAIRASLDETLEGALRRFDESIDRLVTLQRKLLDDQETKLARLAELRRRVHTHEARLREMAGDAVEQRRRVLEGPRSKGPGQPLESSAG